MTDTNGGISHYMRVTLMVFIIKFIVNAICYISLLIVVKCYDNSELYQ